MRVIWRKPGSGRYAIMHAAGYATAAGVALGELVDIPLGPRFALIAGLLALFVVAVTLMLRTEHRPRQWSFIAAAVATSAVALAIMVVGTSPTLGAVLFFVVCTIVAMKLPLGAAIGWVGVAIGAELTCELARGYRDWLPTTLSIGVGFFAIFAFSVAFRRSVQARAESQELLAELTSAQGRLRDLAVVAERQRLAREMHDAVGHRLTAASMLLEGAARLITSDPARATRMVETSRGEVRLGLDELRAAVSALHADPHGVQSTRDILAALVEVFASGSEARVSLEMDPGLAEPDPDRKLVIVRSAQEALTNVRKHSAATRVTLSLAIEGHAYVLTCRDNGRGIVREAPAGAANSGFGLRNLGARAEPFGGQVSLEPGSDGGAVLRLTLPGEGGDA